MVEEWKETIDSLTPVPSSSFTAPHFVGDGVELFKGLQRRQWMGESVNLLSQIWIHRIIRESIIEVRINHFSVSTWIIDLNIYKLINSCIFIFVLPNWFIKTPRDMLLSRIAVRWLSITEVSSLFLPFKAVAYRLFRSIPLNLPSHSGLRLRHPNIINNNLMIQFKIHIIQKKKNECK